MVPSIVVARPDRTPVMETRDYALDMAEGDGDSPENDFTLSGVRRRLEPGWLIWIDGTGWGGIIDQVETTLEGGASSLAYTGRTWRGMLADHVVQPDKGHDYLRLTGTTTECLGALIKRAGLDSLFTVAAGDSATLSGWQADRYATLDAAIDKMLASCGQQLRISEQDDTITLRPIARRDMTDQRLGLASADIKHDSHPVNHIIGLGKGSLKNRARVDWYADSGGTISQTQSLTGVDEVAYVYDLSDEEGTQLSQDAKKKLTDLRGADTVSITVSDGQHIRLRLGDMVAAQDDKTGVTAQARISKRILKVAAGTMSLSYEAQAANASNNGETASGRASASSPGSGTGGTSYTAGAGISISGGTISADVTQSELDAVSKTASSAASSAAKALAAVPSIRVGSVRTGTAGSGAAVSNSGTERNAVLDFTIPRGDTGTTVTLRIGTVTTSESGGRARASIRQDGSTAYLDLTLPRGAAGKPADMENGLDL